MKIKLGTSHIFKTLPAVTKDLGEGMLEAIVATDDVDRHGEILDIAGVDIKNYKNNPVVLWAHDYGAPPIAKAESIKKSDGKIIVKMKFAIDEYPFAHLIYKLYKGGYLNAFSIGFIPFEMSADEVRFTKSEMLEFSAVPVPANANALVQAKTIAKKLGLDKELVSHLKSFAESLDTAENISENNTMNIKDILAKEVGSLTVDEVAVLKAHRAELSEEEVKKFASVLDEKDQIAELKAAFDEKIDSLKKELDPVARKNIKDEDPEKPVIEKGEVTPQMKFLHYVRGVVSKDFSKYLKIVGKSAMNTTDDSQVLPPAEFIAEIERIEESVGVARQYARVRNSSSGKGLTYILGADDVAIFDTNEAGVKQSTKMSFEQNTLLWRKFAGILPMTDELTEDAAMDLWNEATARFARAFARKEDELVFTETSAVSPKNKGLLHVSGTNVVTIDGDSIEDLSYDDFSKAIYGVPTASEQNGRFYLNREILGVVQRIKDINGVPIWQRAMADGTPATILGKPYTLVDVMPNLAADAADKAFIVFGNLDYVTLGMRTGLNMKIFDTGIVGDPDEEDQETNTMNLMTQDMQALRAVKRMNAVVRIPSAFSVIKTGVAGS